MGAQRCYHCGDTIPANTRIHWQHNGEQQAFCCHACKAISQTIQTNKLDDYYLLRDDSGQKPLENEDLSAWDQPAIRDKWLHNDNGVASITLYIEGMHCTACAWLIEKYLGKHPAVQKAVVNFEQSRLQVQWHIDKLPLSGLVQRLADVGYSAHPYQADIMRERQLAENHQLLKRIGITGILMMQIGMFSIGLYAGDFLGINEEHRQLLRVFSMLFAVPLLYYGALPFFIAAFFSLRQRQVNINLSITLAITGLYGSSIYSVFSRSGDIYFDSAAMFCLFILTARYIEKKSRSDLTPPQPVLPAFVIRQAQSGEQRCSLDDIHVGDLLVIPEGDVIPLDGSVVDGESSVSEAFINGESAAIAKTTGSSVYAGSQNHDGRLVIRVSNTPEESLLNKISRISQLAAEEKPRFISITDRIAGRFTLLILSLTIATWLVWLNIDGARAFWVALSVLVVSCPCALSLAAPTALSSVHYRLRRQGLFIRTARVLETLNRTSHVIFDKTGTLTAGRYSIHDAVTDDKEQALDIAAALENHSRHPLARAFSTRQTTLQAGSIRIVANHGIEGRINGTAYRIGSPAFCRQWHQQTTPPDNHKLWVGLCSQSTMLAWFSLQDFIRPEAAAVIDYLHHHKKQTEILSGDSSATVEETAHRLGIETFHKSCSSEDKLAQLKRHHEKGHITLMVGDGINDAPVLAQSDVSVTLLEASDYVKSNADMVLLNNRLSGLVDAFINARRYRRILIQNFSWAFAYNIIAIPIAMSGLITPLWAAAGMSLSSVIVVLNSRRLAHDGSTQTANIASPDRHDVAASTGA